MTAEKLQMVEAIQKYSPNMYLSILNYYSNSYQREVPFEWKLCN